LKEFYSLLGAGPEFSKRRQQLVLTAQKAILRKYGFRAGLEGSLDMQRALSDYVRGDEEMLWFAGQCDELLLSKVTSKKKAKEKKAQAVETPQYRVDGREVQPESQPEPKQDPGPETPSRPEEPKPRPLVPPKEVYFVVRHALNRQDEEVWLKMMSDSKFLEVKDRLAEKLGRNEVRMKGRLVFQAESGTGVWTDFKDEEELGHDRRVVHLLGVALPSREISLRIRHAINEDGGQVVLQLWSHWKFHEVKQALAEHLGREDIRQKAKFVFRPGGQSAAGAWAAFKEEEQVGDRTELNVMCVDDLRPSHRAGRRLEEDRAKTEREEWQKATEEAEQKAKREAEQMADAVREVAKHSGKAEVEQRAEQDTERRKKQEAAQREWEENERTSKDAAMHRASEEAKLRAKAERERTGKEKRISKEELEEAGHKAKEEERKAREETKRRAKEQEEKAQRKREEAQRKAREEAQRKAREEAERQALERKAQEALCMAKEEAERRAKEEAQRKAKEDAAHKAKREAECKAREEAQRKAKEEAEAKEEAARRAKEEAARKAKEEAELKAKHEAERKAKEEAQRKAKEDAARKAKEEAECKAKEEASHKAKEENELKVKQEAKRKAKEAAATQVAVAAQAPPARRSQRELVEDNTPSLHDQEPTDGSRIWIVVGGEDKGGILVRRGEKYDSKAYPVRLTTGSQVEEIEINGNRFHYKRIRGDGPDFGWVNIMLNEKVLLEPSEL